MIRSARLALGATLAVLLALPGSALAANITVDTTVDAIASDTSCSLREAVTAAGDNDMGPGGDCDPGALGEDTIILGATTYELDEANVTLAGEDSNATGDLDINSDLTIDGAGANQTTIDANSIDRVLHMFGAPTVELRDLKITGGSAPGGGMGTLGGNTATDVPSVGGAGEVGKPGGGVLVEVGELTLTSVVVTNNSAGSGGNGGGGGTAGNGSGANPGANSTGGAGGIGGGGGGVALFPATELHATDTVFNQNSAGNGGDAGPGGTGGIGSPLGANGGASIGGQGGFAGDGGAISADNAIVELTRVAMTANEAGVSGNGGQGGTGGAGGTNFAGPSGGSGGASTAGMAVFGGFGGAISQQSTSLTVTDSSLVGNTGGLAGDGGTAGTPGVGGAGNVAPGPSGNGNGGNGGPGGAYGAISSVGGSVNVIRSTVSGNTAGAGGNGGNAPGPLPTGGATSGGDGGDGGFTAGIVQGNSGALNLTNSTVSGNTAGAGGDGGDATSTVSSGGDAGNGGGQAAVSAGSGVTGALVHVTIAANQTGAPGAEGGGDVNGSAGSAGTVGGFHSGGNAVVLRNSIIASNTANQCSGPGFTDGGGNISFPDGPTVTCPASLHTNPLLVALANNGGDTQTMALGPGSPAISAVSANCAPTDQREVGRLATCDAGAFELAAPVVTTGASSGVTTSSANLAGTVNPRTRATTYRFAFGTTPAYGSLTPSVAAGSGAAAVAASAGLTGLAPGTLYHYRVVATNGDGTTVGADRTFTTTTPKTPLAALPAFAGVRILTKSARADRRGRLSVKLRCPPAAAVRCKGRLSLTAKVKRKTIKLGSARFDIAAGKTKTVRIKLSRSKRRLLARSKRLKGTLSASATDNRGGKAKIKKGKLGVKAPKRRR